MMELQNVHKFGQNIYIAKSWLQTDATETYML